MRLNSIDDNMRWSQRRRRRSQLDADLRAARAAISARDDSISERNLKALEDELQVIEEFLAT